MEAVCLFSIVLLNPGRSVVQYLGEIEMMQEIYRLPPIFCHFDFSFGMNKILVMFGETTKISPRK